MRGLLASWPLLCLSFILVCAVVLVSFPMLPVTAHVTGAGGRSRLGAGAGSRLGGRSTAEDTDGRMTHLILVAGHAVYTGKSLEHPEEEANWFLEDSQRGQLSTYLRHIEKGVELASKNPYAALMFSGGQTRSAAGPRSEGLSYWLAASAEGWWGHGDVAGRTVLEEYARDSLENLMFSLCRFREVHGQYPEFVTVVSYSYKQARFQDLHRDAVQFPPDRFHFVGVDPPINPFNDQGNIEKFTADPYGCQEKSANLRARRNPFSRTIPYTMSCPDMSTLFTTCSKNILSRDKVPWRRMWETAHLA